MRACTSKRAMITACGCRAADAMKAAVLRRDYNALLDLGGNVYFLSKIFSTDGVSFAEAVSTMTDMDFPTYRCPPSAPMAQI